MRHLPWLLVLVACGRPDDDADYDGSPDEEDCDPADPTVYPGAPDAPADGVDADCDGTDPAQPFVGAWEVTSLNALYSTYDVIVPGSTEGRLVIADDGSTTLDATADLDPALAGIPISLVMTFDGHASSMAGEGGVAMFLEGLIDATIYEETSTIEFFCTTVDGVMSCEGTLKALETSVLSFANFELE